MIYFLLSCRFLYEFNYITGGADLKRPFLSQNVESRETENGLSAFRVILID